MAEPAPTGRSLEPVRDEYLAFARGQAAGVSPTYEALARAVAA